MFESLLTIGLGLIGERVFDYVKRRREATRELVRKVARAIFDRVASMVREDRDEAHRLYRGLAERGLMAAGFKVTPHVVDILDAVFEELWEARKKDLWDTAMAELASAGKRAERLADALKRQTTETVREVRK